jgi:hypothetical protein
MYAMSVQGNCSVPASCSLILDTPSQLSAAFICCPAKHQDTAAIHSCKINLTAQRLLFAGTTTATVLARAILNEGCKSVAAGMNPMDLRRGINLAVDNVLQVGSAYSCCRVKQVFMMCAPLHGCANQRQSACYSECKVQKGCRIGVSRATRLAGGSGEPATGLASSGCSTFKLNSASSN